MKAYLTRDADMFLPLHERARRASANKADIFLSIHADAAENRNARGSSVYVLSTKGASSQRARWLADKENAADIIGGDRARLADNTLASVLLDLTQSGNIGLENAGPGAGPEAVATTTSRPSSGPISRSCAKRTGCAMRWKRLHLERGRERRWTPGVTALAAARS